MFSSCLFVFLCVNMLFLDIFGYVGTNLYRTSNPNTWSFDDHKDGCLRAALKLAETLVRDVDVSQP